MAVLVPVELLGVTYFRSSKSDTTVQRQRFYITETPCSSFRLAIIGLCLDELVSHSYFGVRLVVFFCSGISVVLAVQRRLFCFGSLVILDVVCRYISLFLLYINMKMGKMDIKC